MPERKWWDDIDLGDSEWLRLNPHDNGLYGGRYEWPDYAPIYVPGYAPGESLRVAEAWSVFLSWLCDVDRTCVLLGCWCGRTVAEGEMAYAFMSADIGGMAPWC